MLDSNAPAGQIDRLGLGKAWRRGVYAFLGATVVLLTGIPDIVQQIDLNPVLGDMLGDSVEKLIAAAIAGGVAWAIKFIQQLATNYAPDSAK